MFIVAQQTDFRSQLNSWQARVLFLTVVQARTLTSTRNFQLFKGFYLHPSRNSNTPPPPTSSCRSRLSLSSHTAHPSGNSNTPLPPHIILQVTTVPFQSHSPPFQKQQHPPPPPHHLTGHDCPFPVTQSTLLTHLLAEPEEHVFNDRQPLQLRLFKLFLHYHGTKK
jgi:hypothetical protein